MKVFVIGSHGMLGRYVVMHLCKTFEVIELNRDIIDAANVTESQLTAIMFHNKLNSGDVVINCAGIINKLVDEVGELHTLLVNSIFPRILANVVEKADAKMIHPTTDCVFDGLRINLGYNFYNENAPHSPTDFYGKTKSLGEPANCSVIRTSIIGEEVNQGRSLIEWVKRNHDKQIPGYTNHIWNGVTCYQFAKICQEIIQKNLFWNGIRHIFSNAVSKFELVTAINAIYSLHITVNPKETPVECDRTLGSIYSPVVLVPTLASQIAELREVEYELYGTRVAE